MSPAAARPASLAAPNPVTEQILAAAAFAFALWTLCSHFLVAVGGSLRTLVLSFAGCLTLAVASALLRARGRTSGGPGAASAIPGREIEPGATASADRAALLLGAAGIAAALALAIHRSPLLLWWSILAVLGGAAAVRVLRESPPAARPPLAGTRRELAVLALALCCAALALILHRPDADDSFYVNVAASAADLPGAPLLVFDTLHGIPDLPLHQPIYRLHSIELALGAAAWLSGVPAIAVFHLGATAVFAALVPLAWAALFRRLTPQRWLFATTAFLAILFSAADTHRWYGNFAFPRIWQGKSIYLFVWLPLVYARAIDFARDPGLGRGLWLMAVQIAAVGASSSAVWEGPAASLLALASTLRPDRRGLRTFAQGALASGYVIAMGWWLMQGDIANHDPLLQRAQIRAVGRAWAPGVEFSEALRTVFGAGSLFGASLAALASSWAFCGRAELGRRFAIVVPLVVWGALLNPFLERDLAKLLTGPSYWRVLWCIPVPLLLALVLSAPLRLPQRAWPRLAACIALLGFCAGVPRFSVFSARNEPREVHAAVSLGWPRLKVPRSGSPSDYEWAALLNEVAGPEGVVLAPEYVALWVPTFHHPARPLLVRESYLRKFLDRLGRDEVRPRRVMTRLVEGKQIQPDAQEVLREGIDRFRVRAVLLRESEVAAELRSLLGRAGFLRQRESPEHELWVRREGLPAAIR